MPSILAVVLAAAASAAQPSAAPGGELPVVRGGVELQQVTLREKDRFRIASPDEALLYALDSCQLVLEGPEGARSEIQTAPRSPVVVELGYEVTVKAKATGEVPACQLLVIRAQKAAPESKGNTGFTRD